MASIELERDTALAKDVIDSLTGLTADGKSSQSTNERTGMDDRLVGERLDLGVGKDRRDRGLSLHESMFMTGFEKV